MYSITEIKSVVQDMAVRSYKNDTSFQLEFEEMKNKTRVLSGLEICTRLVKAHEALTAAGYNADIRLSYQNQSGAWAAWPCIWVNKESSTQAQTAEVSARIERVESALEQLIALVQGKSEEPAKATTKKSSKKTKVDSDGDAQIPSDGDVQF